MTPVLEGTEADARVLEKLLECVRELSSAPPDLITGDALLLEEGILDSFEMVELIERAEGEFGMQINVDDFIRDYSGTARSLASLILHKM